MMQELPIALTPELQRALNACVASGFYADAGEVVREALRRFLIREGNEAATLAGLRAAVAVGAEEAERGEFTQSGVMDILTRLESPHP